MEETGQGKLLRCVRVLTLELNLVTSPFPLFFLPSFLSLVAMYREPSLHDVGETVPKAGVTPSKSTSASAIMNGGKPVNKSVVTYWSRAQLSDLSLPDNSAPVAEEQLERPQEQVPWPAKQPQGGEEKETTTPSRSSQRRSSHSHVFPYTLRSPGFPAAMEMKPPCPAVTLCLLPPCAM
ncbi:hypothetical protein QTO34_016713 [Cnephaeus nilssonii]|uniref:Uncharacterized protein n=1 Tax=Cnephaeus nilssonii TaxID=3371016 RepID=A0AA40I3G4_CNENI|nr:hypothetical protein QTO34_016713 [Eptesicus nilssonii]